MDLSDLAAHFNIGFSFDGLVFNVYRLEYPAYCTFDLVSLVTASERLICGYNGDEIRIAPMYS